MKNNSTKLQKYKIVTYYVFALFFFSICFVTTINIFLFSSELSIPEIIVRTNAPKVFINIFILSVLFTVIAYIFGYYTSFRHVNTILTFTDKVATGDYRQKLIIKKNNFDLHGYESIKDNMNKMVEALNSVETLKTDFISNVSHEIKTPLSVIQNCATLLQDKNLSQEDLAEYSKQIVSQTSNLSLLITNILRLNKLENQQIGPSTAEINVSELVCECMLDFEQSWEEKELSIETDIAGDIMLFSDSELLKIVINNLISNAIKFTNNKGTIGIKVEESGKNEVLISVKDTGCGMDSKTSKHMFEKFYQGDISRSIQGNGLGLALVKKIIEILGYEIKVDSKVGIGSTFTLICKK